LAAIADFRQAGELFSQSGNYNRAIAAYDQILELSPGAVQIYQLRGWVQIWAGGTQAGLLDLEKALSLDDDNWRARFQLGKALCLTGDYKHAEKHLKKIRKYGEEQPQILAFLALSYLGRDKTGDAVKYYIKYSELATPGSDRQVANLSDWITLTTLAAQER
jgi:tetratricopeptide (TPR) repeat protein